MSQNIQPSEAPPAYDSVPGARPANNGGNPVATSWSTANTSTGAGRNAQRRDSSQEEQDIEQEQRQLPPGWVPQYDASHDRFFFVDTRNPKGPRSIWTHPLDDPEWQSTVPRGMDPEHYVDQLWQNEPEPTPEPTSRPLPPQTQSYRGGIQSQISSEMQQPGYQPRDLPEHLQGQQQQQVWGPAGPGVRQGGTSTMQSPFPGTVRMVNGQQVQRVKMEDLVQHELAKMGTPEEYEKRNPPGKTSKLFHKKETARQRQRRHAEHRARDLADDLMYRAPVYPPSMGYGRGYGYPGYGRGYGGYYPGLGMSGAMLGLGGGALLGAALF